MSATRVMIRAADYGEPDKVIDEILDKFPQRWTDNILDWTKELIFQKIKNNGKYLIVKFRK